MKSKDTWPKGLLIWEDETTRYISVPFTWLMPAAKQEIIQSQLFGDRKIRVGGPAVDLMPDYLAGIGADVGGSIPGVLQRFNPLATKTSTGCPLKCKFCSVPIVEGAMNELGEWPDLPIICDNNFLQCTQPHFDKVCDRLEKWGWADFNQGLDCRRLTDYHVERLKRIGKVQYRLALDNTKLKNLWQKAFDRLRAADIPRRSIGSYIIIGFDSGVEDAWDRCKWVDDNGARPYPMWFHPLDSLERNVVTKAQADLGWNDYERRRIMQWFYQHKRAVV